MNRFHGLALLLCLATMLTATAAHIGQQQAQAIAAGFMAGKNIKSPHLTIASKTPMLGSQPGSDKVAYYVFNNEGSGNGFVIVAGDDRVPAVLGYSDSGTFDADALPPAMQEWLDGYAAQVAAISAGAIPEVRSVSRAAIAPMLNVHWGQGMPYNVLLPHISGSSNAHAYVGCVAVAMAQVMAYWQYPECPTQTIPGYTSSSGKTYAVYMPSLAPIDFDWSNMHDTYYTNDSTSDACMAVAQLMRYSTTSMQSNFGLTSTGAYTRNIPDRLITYFGYKNTAHYLYRNDFSTQAWEDTIYNELAAGRPVAYGGNKKSSGHAFVCDGYDGEGRFHINWGWAGKSNGYFLLNLLNPSDEGIGAAAGAYGYVLNQGACVGLQPDDGTAGTASLMFEGLTINSTNTVRASASSKFSVTVSGRFVNNTNVSSQFRQGWGLYKDGELVEVLFTRTSTGAIGNGGYIDVSSRNLSFGSGITSGTYRILPIYAIYPGEDYRPCVGSDVNYIEVTFGGTYTCTVKGYGNAGSNTRYSVNDFRVDGTLNHGKPVTVTLNLTNTGTTTNDMIYMFVDGEFNAMGLAGIGAGEQGDLVYRFTPTTEGTKTLTFSLNESGTSPFYTQRVTINTMPAASLEVSYRILGITDEDNRIMTADRYSIIADITNAGTAPYDEDFSVRLYRINNDETNVGTELLNQTQPLYLAPGDSTSLQFDFERDLINGWKYFCYLYYYSEGEPVGTGTRWYILNLTDTPVAGRHSVNVAASPAAGGIVKVTGGTISGKATEGATVTFTARPNVGWQCGEATVTAADGTPAVVTDNGDGTYSFVMPADDVDIVVAFTRSMGNRFELVTTRSDITGDGTYVIATKYYDKVMKFHEQGEATFGAVAVGEWLNEEKSLVRVNDEACFIRMEAVNSDTIRAGATSGDRTNAFLSTGNGYLTTRTGNLIVSDACTNQCRAGMFVSSNEYNYLVRFFNEASGSSSDYMTVRYDYAGSHFKILNYSSDTQQRVWLYKLVDSYKVQTDARPGDGGDINLESGVFGGAAQVGETVTFTVIVGEHYDLASVTVVTDGGDTVAVSLDEGTDLYSFVMPAKNVTISAEFAHHAIPQPLLGDVNANGEITIGDVTTLINYLLTGSASPFAYINADMNRDGNISILDVSMLINLLLSAQ